jgi:hypothetical protein
VVVVLTLVVVGSVPVEDEASVVVVGGAVGSVVSVGAVEVLPTAVELESVSATVVTISSRPHAERAAARASSGTPRGRANNAG